MVFDVVHDMRLIQGRIVDRNISSGSWKQGIWHWTNLEMGQYDRAGIAVARHVSTYGEERTLEALRKLQEIVPGSVKTLAETINTSRSVAREFANKYGFLPSDVESLAAFISQYQQKFNTEKLAADSLKAFGHSSERPEELDFLKSMTRDMKALVQRIEDVPREPLPEHSWDNALWRGIKVEYTHMELASLRPGDTLEMPISSFSKDPQTPLSMSNWKTRGKRPTIVKLVDDAHYVDTIDLTAEPAEKEVLTKGKFTVLKIDRDVAPKTFWPHYYNDAQHVDLITVRQETPLNSPNRHYAASFLHPANLQLTGEAKEFAKSVGVRKIITGHAKDKAVGTYVGIEDFKKYAETTGLSMQETKQLAAQGIVDRFNIPNKIVNKAFDLIERNGGGLVFIDPWISSAQRSAGSILTHEAAHRATLVGTDVWKALEDAAPGPVEELKRLRGGRSLSKLNFAEVMADSVKYFLMGKEMSTELTTIAKDALRSSPYKKIQELAEKPGMLGDIEKIKFAIGALFVGGFSADAVQKHVYTEN